MADKARVTDVFIADTFDIQPPSPTPADATGIGDRVFSRVRPRTKSTDDQSLKTDKDKYDGIKST